ncbi:MAG: DUF362 domain-containing protein [bacterium]
MNDKYTRRDFIGKAAVTGLALYGMSFAGCKSGFSRTLAQGPRERRANGLKKGVFVARGSSDPAKLTRSAVDAAGGMGKLVKRGDIVVVKPNIGWDRSPEQAANTNPAVVAALVAMALEAGAKEVKVFDRSCNSDRRTYKRSGIAAAAEKAGAKVSFVDESRYVSVTIPGARALKEWMLNRDALECNVFINVPILKDHGATRMTAGMKNLMGIAGGERGAWHVGELDQRIADVQLAIKPDLVVIDAFRILTAHGPQGGSLDDVKELKTIAVSTDIVAADAYAAKLFGVDPKDIKHIRIAEEMGLGSMKPVSLKEINV